MDYDNFEIEVELATGREFEVSVRSRAGEASQTMRFPYDQLALDNRLKDLQIALLRSGGRTRRLNSPEEQAVQNFGTDLFNALIANEVRNRYDVSHELAVREDRGLRLVLRIQDPGLAALPWEFMYDERKAEFICLSRDTPIVRYPHAPQPVQPLLVDPPLRILCMAVSPTDLEPLDVQRERQRLDEAIKRLGDLVTVTWLEGKTWQDLQAIIQKGSWHIFHFIGHAGFNESRREGFIVLANDKGRSFELAATQLARLLDSRQLKLVVLNACEGARGNTLDVFSSTASVLIRSRVPAVVAMQYEITDAAAIEFSRSFYRAIAQGLSLEAAVVEARKAISIGVNNTVEWGTPVLYLRSASGRLFNVDLKPHQAKKLYEEASAALAASNWSLAIEKTKTYLEQVPNHEGAQQLLQTAETQRALEKSYEEGLQHFDAGRFHEAKPTVQKEKTKTDLIKVTKIAVAVVIAIAACIWIWTRMAKPGPDEPGKNENPQSSNANSSGSKTDKATVSVPVGMVYVPGGEVTIGLNKRDGGDVYESPAHKVVLKPFFIDRTEVTNEDYKKCVDAGKCKPPNTWTNRNFADGDSLKPVTGVSWHDAKQFAEWAGKRLPTEEEWELAAKGFDGRRYPWGNKWIDGYANANTKNGRLMNVGEHKNGASPFGALDMVGNVWEWTDSDLTAYPGGTLPKEAGPGTKVVRGGNFGTTPGRGGASTTYRLGLLPSQDSSAYESTGFRCIQDVPSQAQKQ